jgi:hypothetical protein
MKDDKTLADYGIVGSVSSGSTRVSPNGEEGREKEYEMKLVILKKDKGKLNIGKNSNGRLQLNETIFSKLRL